MFEDYLGQGCPCLGLGLINEDSSAMGQKQLFLLLNHLRSTRKQFWSMPVLPQCLCPNSIHMPMYKHFHCSKLKWNEANEALRRCLTWQDLPVPYGHIQNRECIFRGKNVFLVLFLKLFARYIFEWKHAKKSFFVTITMFYTVLRNMDIPSSEWQS